VPAPGPGEHDRGDDDVTKGRAGVEINVIPGWLGHVSLDTTNRYAEINMRSKEAALEACQPPVNVSVAFPRRPIWRDDATLLDWLTSL
jgi:integrase/recombinase XerD